MMKKGLIGLLSGTLLWGAAGMALADSKTDDRVEDRIESRLKESPKTDRIHVDVENGVATLSGDVANSSERVEAEKLARQEGAKRVVNNLKIDVDKTVDRIKDNAEAKKDAIDKRAEQQKDAVDRQADLAKDRAERGVATSPSSGSTSTSAGNAVGDSWVTAKVKTKIMSDSVLDKSDVTVDTDRDGVVTLKGDVPSPVAKARAIEIARTTDGVHRVVDKLSVKAPVTQ